MTIRNRDEIPDVPAALLEHLEAAIPPRCPELSTPERQIWHYCGQRSVVEMLRVWHNARYNPQVEEE